MNRVIKYSCEDLIFDVTEIKLDDTLLECIWEYGIFNKFYKHLSGKISRVFLDNNFKSIILSECGFFGKGEMPKKIGRFFCQNNQRQINMKDNELIVSFQTDNYIYGDNGKVIDMGNGASSHLDLRWSNILHIGHHSKVSINGIGNKIILSGDYNNIAISGKENTVIINGNHNRIYANLCESVIVNGIGNEVYCNNVYLVTSNGEHNRIKVNNCLVVKVCSTIDFPITIDNLSTLFCGKREGVGAKYLFNDKIYHVVVGKNCKANTIYSCDVKGNINEFDCSNELSTLIEESKYYEDYLK